MTDALRAEEHLRRALVELERANRHFVAAYGRVDEAERAARHADEARHEAARWAAIARAAQDPPDEE